MVALGLTGEIVLEEIPRLNISGTISQIFKEKTWRKQVDPLP